MAKEGLSVRLPLGYDKIDGPYQLNKGLNDVIQQNLKMVILTEPGERCMDMDFGVGLKRLLFEPVHPTTYERIKRRIREQVQKYISYVEITDIIIGSSGPIVQVSIRYKLGDFEEESVLNISQVID
jgi:phage baseplate assembly protein W